MSGDLLPRLQAAFSKGAVEAAAGFGPAVTVPSADLPAVCQTLRGPDWGFDVLEDLTALDSGDRFTLVLHLASSAAPGRHLTVKAGVDRSRPEAPSLAGLYGSADWYEREVFDLFGIVFTGHPDLRRILLPEDWQGHPLRKDYADDKLLKRPGA